MNFFFSPTSSSVSLGPGSLRTSPFPNSVFEIPSADALAPEQLPSSLPEKGLYQPQLPEDPRKILVLDLDETLIHTSTFPPHKDVKSLKFDHDGKIDYVFLRPDVEAFLERVAQMFEVFIFTASTKAYADPILDQLCPQIDQCHRFYRDSCKFSSKKVKKDLTKFGKPLSQVIMIDDNRHMKDTYPGNTIFIDRWNGTPYDDTLMNTIMPILQKCEEIDDVRKVLQSFKKKAVASCERFANL